MRTDMFKVIVERPRRGVGYYRTLQNDYRAAKRFKLDIDDQVHDEFCGSKLPMRARALGYEGKELNENLNPLRRFLKQQIGRRWDDVYSEICEHLDTGSTVKQHVRQHIPDFICTKTFYDEDGDLRAITRWGIKDVTWNDLYVNPEGIVCGRSINDRPRYNWKKEKEKRRLETEKDVDKFTRFVKVDGLWFFVRYEDYPTDVDFEDYRFSFKRDVLGNSYKDLHPKSFRFYGGFGRNQVAVSKQSASHKQIVKYNLL